MKDEKVEVLKKKIKGEAICSIIIAVVMGLFAVGELSIYIFRDGEFVDMLGKAILGFVVFVAFILISLIMLEITKNGKPFSKSIILKLRVLGIWVMLGAYLPDTITFIVEFIKTNAGYYFVEISNVFVSLLGVLLVIISEIFCYGYELQEDNDSIA